MICGLPLMFSLACSQNNFEEKQGLTVSASSLESSNMISTKAVATPTYQFNFETKTLPSSEVELKSLENLIAQKLAKYPQWTQLNFTIDPAKPNGAAYTTTKSKKFKMSQNKLIDIGPLSKDYNKVIYNFKTSDFLNQVFENNSFIKSEGIRYKILSKDAFVIENMSTKIIFMPSLKNPFSKPMKVNFEHFSTEMLSVVEPNSEGDINLGNIFASPKNYTSILRHDLSKKRLVFVPLNFPDQFISDLKLVIQRWNKSLGKEFYVYVNKQNLDYDECFAQSYLCLDWSGGSDIAMTGIGGVSSIGYDVQSGLIHGGVIGFKNTNQDIHLAEMQPELVKDLNSTDTQTRFKVAAQLFAQRKEYFQTKNPFPHESVQAILVHEFGHDIGFRHYFAGSKNPSKTRFGDTVMDYYPFSATKNETSPGLRDQNKIDIIYKNKNTASLKEESCSDAEVNFKKDCNAWDLGPTYDWAMELANQSANDIETVVDSAGGISMFGASQKTVWRLLSDFIIPDFIFDASQLPTSWSQKQTQAFILKQKEIYKKQYAQNMKLDIKVADKIHNFLCESKRRQHLINYLNDLNNQGYEMNFTCEFNKSIFE
jgi:hypothetical protein